MEEPPPDGLRVELDGPVVRVTLDRDDENLVSLAMCRCVTSLLLDPPEGARVLHLRSSRRAFCLGRERGGGGADALRAEARVLVELNQALSGAELFTVAEVSGDAAGFGAGLAALCDFSVASGSARFWFPEVEIGLAPTVVLAWLPQLVGRREAIRLTATAARVDGWEAARLGLVTRAAGRADAVARMAREEIDALLRHDRDAQREIKAFVRDTEGAERSIAEDLAVDRLALSSLRARAREHRSSPTREAPLSSST